MTKRGWVVYRRRDAERNRDFIRWLIEEAKRVEIDLQLVLREELFVGTSSGRPSIRQEGKFVQLPAFVIVRTPEPLFSFHLETLGIRTFNSYEISFICNHKARTYQAMARLGIPMLDTVYMTGEQLSTYPPFAYPFVVKTATGRGGDEVFLVENASERSTLGARYTDTDLVAQPLAPVIGRDVRVFVVGKTIVGAVLRLSNTDFRANYSLGGQVRWFELNHKQRELVSRVVETYEVGMVGIDFLFDEDGDFLFNEMEDVVGSRSLSHVRPTENIVRRYMQHIVEHI